MPFLSRARRVLRRNWLASLVVVVLLWIVATGVLLYSAAQDVRSGRDVLRSVESRIDDQDVDDSSLDGSLLQAAGHLENGHRKLSNPLVAPFRIVPFVGRQLRSATALTGAAEVMARTSYDTIAKARTLSDAVGDDRVQALTSLDRLSRDAAREVDDIDLGPEKGLIGPLRDARAEASTRLADAKTALRRGGAAIEAIATLLSREDTYLVLAGNSAEARAGSGMFLSAGSLRTGNGSVDLGDMRSIGEASAPVGSVQWPTELQTLWGWLEKQHDYRNLMASPRFDVSAPIAADVWEKAERGDVDGVIAIDTKFLEAILRATGPITVDGQTIDGDNVVNLLLYEQYQSLDGRDVTQIARREKLSDVARIAFERLDTGAWEPVQLAREIAKAANGRHLLVWSKDQGLNGLWQRAGVGGELYSDSLMMNVLNIGGNKLDYFLDVDATIDHSGSSEDEVTVTVQIANNAPSSGPEYVMGPFPGSGLKRGEYQGMLSFSLPTDAAAPRFDDGLPLTVDGVDGPSRVVATKINLLRGETKTFTLRFTLAAGVPFVVEPSARVPATDWHAAGVSWKDDHRRTVVR